MGLQTVFLISLPKGETDRSVLADQFLGILVWVA